MATVDTRLFTAPDGAKEAIFVIATPEAMDTPQDCWDAIDSEITSNYTGTEYDLYEGGDGIDEICNGPILVAFGPLIGSYWLTLAAKLSEFIRIIIKTR